MHFNIMLQNVSFTKMRAKQSEGKTRRMSPCSPSRRVSGRCSLGEEGEKKSGEAEFLYEKMVNGDSKLIFRVKYENLRRLMR